MPGLRAIWPAGYLACYDLIMSQKKKNEAIESDIGELLLDDFAERRKCPFSNIQLLLPQMVHIATPDIW